MSDLLEVFVHLGLPEVGSSASEEEVNKMERSRSRPRLTKLKLSSDVELG